LEPPPTQYAESEAGTTMQSGGILRGVARSGSGVDVVSVFGAR
jgi:hypothetical protein